MCNIVIISTNQLQEPYPVYPLGVSYLETYLKKNLPLAQVEILDRNICTDVEILQKTENVDYVCISFRNVDDTNIFQQKSFVQDCQELIEKIRQCSTAKIILGGAGFSIFPKILFDLLKPDFAVYSEGESALVEIIRSLENNLDYTNIEGLVYKDEMKQTLLNPRNVFLKKTILDVDESLVDYYWEKSGMLNVQTKRGCPFKCIYCSYPIIEGRKLRTLDIDCIIENIQKLAQKGINYLFFTDSVFNLDKNYNQELAEKIIQSGVKIQWGAYFSPYKLEKEELALYKRSGLTHVEFGTDSFSETQLENYQKPFSFSDVLRASEYCSDLGIFFAHFLILAGLGETNKTLDEGFENSKKIQHSVFFPFIGMRIYPNTKLFEIAKKEGLIEDELSLIQPKYYIPSTLDISMIQEKAAQAGGKWIFGNQQDDEKMELLRKRGRKGPLWEYLRY